jgi:hypothetical protein
MKTLNPANPANSGGYSQAQVDALLANKASTDLATTTSAGLMSAEDKARLDALSGSTEKLVCSTTVTISASKSAGSTTVTLAEDSDYITISSITVANEGTGKYTTSAWNDSDALVYRTITVTFTGGNTVNVAWASISSAWTSSVSSNIKGYKYLI